MGFGARREGRTPTLLREPDFESGASASSAIRALTEALFVVERLFLTLSLAEVKPLTRQLGETPCNVVKFSLILS